MTKSFIRNSAAAVLVFDVSSKETFKNISYWMSTFRDDNPRSYILLVGNKVSNSMLAAVIFVSEL